MAEALLNTNSRLLTIEKEHDENTSGQGGDRCRRRNWE